MKKRQKSDSFDFDSFEKEAISKLMQGHHLGGENGALTPLIKRFIEKALNAEMEGHLSEGIDKNRRNGKGSKHLKTDLGKVEINTPRDREGTFDPVIVPKRQRSLPGTLEEQIISMYAKGMSYEAIRGHMLDIYGLQVSEAKISNITDKIVEDVHCWQNRPLAATYVIVWLDAIHYRVREEGKVISKAVYSIMGVNQSGYKELLGLYIGENEGAKFWLGVLEQIKKRGVQDILIACIDNLKGFAETIQLIYPNTDVQSCIVHQVRNTSHYIPHKDIREVIRDMKLIYQANTIEEAEYNLEFFAQKWEKKYPKAVESWQNNWPKLCTFLHYPDAIRKLIYTTNPIESLHSQLRKITKSKRSFSNDKALIKLLYLVQRNVTDKWENSQIFRWSTIKSQLIIIFEDRINPDTLY